MGFLYVGWPIGILGAGGFEGLLGVSLRDHTIKVKTVLWKRLVSLPR